MHALKARVHNGRLVLDEPTHLPEGTEIDLVIADDEDELDDAERAALHAALDRGWASVQRGDLRPPDDLLRKLRGGA